MEDFEKVIEVNVKYERAVKNYGGGGVETEYFPTMPNGSIIVKKTSVGNIAIIGSSYGVIDKYGKEIVPCIYDSCSPINQDYYIVGKDYTECGMSGDDFSFPKQVYGIVNANGKVLVPLTMKGIYYNNDYVSICGFNNEYYIGVLDQDGKLNINEGMSNSFKDSLEDIYNSITGTGKITAIGQGFILRDGAYSSCQEFKEAYYKSINSRASSFVDSEPSHKVR